MYSLQDFSTQTPHDKNRTSSHYPKNIPYIALTY